MKDEIKGPDSRVESRERLRSVLSSIAFYLVAMTVSYTAFYSFSRNLELFQYNYLPFKFDRMGVLTDVTPFGPHVNKLQVYPGDRLSEVNGLMVGNSGELRKAVAASKDGVTALVWEPSSGREARQIRWMNVAAMPELSVDGAPGMLAGENPLFVRAGIDPESRLAKVSVPVPWWDKSQTAGQMMVHFVFEGRKNAGPTQELVLALLDRRISWGLYGVAISFCLLGLLVYRLQPRSGRARGFFFFCSFMALFYFTRSIQPMYKDVWDHLLMDQLMALSPIATVLFVATFTPMRVVLAGEKRPAILALSATGILLTLMGLGMTQAFILAWLAFVMSMMISSIVASIWIVSRQRQTSARERQGGLIYLIAMGLAFIPYSIYMVIRIAAGWGAEEQIYFEALPFLFPIIIGYAILRHNLLNVHELVLQGFLFTILAAFLVVGYGLVAAVVAPVIETIVLVDSLWIVGAGVALLVLGAMPVYQALRRRLESRFERGLARYDELIRDIERVRADEREVGEFLSYVLQRIARISETPGVAIVRTRVSESDGVIQVLATTSDEFSANLVESLSVGERCAELDRGEVPEEATTGIPDVPVMIRIRNEDGGLELLALGEKIFGGSHGWHELTKLRQAARAIALAMHGFDIRERVREKSRLEAELLQSQKLEALGALAGGITHDFNNLLYAISSFTTLANDAITPEHPAHAALNHVEEAARQARNLTGSLLRYVRASAAAPSPVDLTRLVREASEMLRRLLPGAIDLDVTLPEEQVFMNADEGQIYQVVMNLVLNARDAMPNGGRIGVSLSRENESEGDRIRFEVEDSGSGMTPELRARIFDPGFTTKSGERGVGLGLSIVRRIVANYSGRIEVVSEPEVGTKFIVELPVTSPSKLEEVRRTASGKLLIGLLIPEAETARVLASRIRSRGWKIISLKSADALADLAGEESGFPDVLVADAASVKANGGGAELLKRHPELPVLFVGEDLDGDLGDEETTRVQCVPKPCSIEQLIEGISLVLEPAQAPAAP